MNADAIREAYGAVCAAGGSGVTVVAATKYVSAEDMGILAEAGIEIVGENRVQDMRAQARAARRDASAGTSSARCSPTRHAS